MKITEEGELPLPPGAAEALNGASYVTVETSFGNIVLRPAEAGAQGAVPLGADGVALPENELGAVFSSWRWPGDREYEAVIEDAGYIVFGPPGDPDSMRRARREFAGEEESEARALRSLKESRRALYEKEQSAKRGRESARRAG